MNALRREALGNGCGEAWVILTTTERQPRVTENGTLGRQTKLGSVALLGAAALCVAACIALGAVVTTGRTLAFDERVHHLVRGQVPTAFEEDDRSPRTRLMHLGPDIGTATILVVPLAALALVGLRRRHAAALVVCSAAGAAILTLLLKGGFQRTRAGEGCCHRPWQVIGYLYPSTHTVMTIVIYGLIAALIGARLTGWRRTLVVIITLALVAFVAISLIYLNTHYLTDVIGGALLGCAWLIISLHALARIEASRVHSVMNSDFAPLYK